MMGHEEFSELERFELIDEIRQLKGQLAELRKVEPGWLTTSDVAKEAGVTPATVRVWANVGKLPCTTTAGGNRLFRRVEVDMFLTRRSETKRISA